VGLVEAPITAIEAGLKKDSSMSATHLAFSFYSLAAILDFFQSLLAAKVILSDCADLPM
jgi:hypothetical protein